MVDRLVQSEQCGKECVLTLEHNTLKQTTVGTSGPQALSHSKQNERFNTHNEALVTLTYSFLIDQIS